MKKINFSSATTTRMFQTSIDSDIEKKQGKSFAPFGNKCMTIFLDDVAMVRPDFLQLGVLLFFLF